VSAVETPPPPEETVAEPRCPRCGAPMSEAQEWCLNCGAAVGTRVVAAPGWRVPIAIAVALLAIAAIAVAIAIVQLADDTDQVAQQQPAEAASQAVPAPTATPSAAATPESTLTPDPTLPEASGQETPTPDTGGSSSSGGGGDAEWPASKTGWTVVLASDTSESDARDKAEDFAADGISGVGVLDSDDFPSLRGGFWVVFAGQYDSQSEAADALDGIDARDAYIRRIEPA
jgi:SPOR domain